VRQAARHGDHAKTARTAARRTSAGSRLSEPEAASDAVNRTVKVHLPVPERRPRRDDRTWPSLYPFHGGADGHRSRIRETDVERLDAGRRALIAMRTSACPLIMKALAMDRPDWQFFDIDRKRPLPDP